MKLKRLYIEITNYCNLKCSFCSDSKRELRSLSIDEFKVILNQIKPHCEYVYLHIKGEPMIHPHFKEFLDLLEINHFQVQLVSNGSLLKNHPTLLEYKCIRKVSFSLHSIDFQLMDVNEYMQPLIDFAKSASVQGHPYVEFRFWTSDNLTEKAKQCLSLLTNQQTLIETKKKNSYEWIKNCYVHFDHEFIWPIDSFEDNTNGTCLGSRSMLGILSDGTVVPCCLDDHGSINLGNIFESSFESILQNKRLICMQKGFNQNKLIEPLCQKCNYRKRFD